MMVLGRAKHNLKLIKKLVFVLILFALSLIFMPKVYAYTVTYPDNKVDTVEEGQKYILSMKDHKEPEIVSTVTFKSHQDGVDDYVSHVKKKYFLEKWIIDGVEYEPGSPIEVNSDITVTGSYHEYIEPVTIPSGPLVYGYTFIGWYDQEEGGTRYKTYSGTQDLTLHAQYIVENKAPFNVEVTNSKWTKFKSTATAFRKATVEEYNAKQAELTSSDNYGNDYHPIYIWLEGTELVYYTEASSITITRPNRMFNNWSKIEYIDLSGWYIRYLSANYEISATDISYMFNNCSSLTYLDISDFDTSKVTNMNYMFTGIKLASLDLSHFNTSEVTSMAGMFSNMESLEYLNISSFNTSKVTTMQSMFSNSKINYLDLSNFNTSNVTGMSSMFSNSKNANYLNISSFDTSKVTYMTSMFSSSSFKHLDLSNLDVSQVNSFENVFYNAQSLEYVDLSNWDTRRSTNFSRMFKNCYNLKYLDLSSFKIYKATNLTEMFRGCRNLEELDLSSFDLNNVNYINYMFAEMSKIKTIDISNFSTPNLKIMQCLFCDDTSLETIYANELFNTDQCPTGVMSDGTMVYVFLRDDNLAGQAGTRYAEARGSGKEYAVIDDPDNGKPGYFTYKAYNPKIYYPDMSYEEVEPYYVLTLPESYSKADDNLAKVTLKYEDDKTEDKEVYVKKSYTFNNWLVYDEVAEPGDTFVITFDTYLEADYVETINGVDLPTAKRTNYIFEGWYTDPVNGDLVENYNGNEDITLYAHWREAQVANLIPGEQFNNKLNKNVTGEFRKATLEEYNLVRDTLTTDNIVSTSESPSVVYLWSTDSDILYYTDAEIVYVNENAYKMFSDLSVTSIDLNGLDTSNTTNMGYFFQRFKGSSLDVSTLDTSKATDMHGIFWYNENLTTIDVSNFNTSNATTISEMFYDSYNLETIIGLDNFDTSNVTDMSRMFDSCRKLKELDLTHFNTSKVTNYNFMFRDSILIEELDLSSFETVNSPGISYMFYGMTGLRNVYVSNKWDHSKISTSSNVFYGNNELIGYYGWTYKGSTNDETYARADTTDPNNRGYFTDISHKGETNTVTYPDGVVEVYPHNYKVYFRHNETIKPSEEVATVTLKYHDGVTEDTTMPVLQRYSPNGYLINNQATSNEHKDEISSYVLTYDTVLEYDYLENEKSTDPFPRPEREGYSFFGWYTEEDGQGEKYTQYYDSEDIVLHAYWNDPYAEFVPGYEFSSKMNNLIYGPEYDYDHPAKYFRKATLEEYNLAKDMIESDVDENGNNKYIVSSENTGDLIYAWKSGDDLLYYSKTDNIYLNEYSSSMFSNLPFEEIDLSGINAINSNSLNGFFNGCGNLVSINFGDKFDTSNVTDMSYMFASSSIKQIDLSVLDTSNVTNMSYMFNYAESLETINFGNIDTSKVTEMRGMFQNCSSLTEIDLSKQNLNNVQYAGYMFQECTSLTSLKLSKKRFSNIINAENMFSNCSSLEELDLTRFDTSNLEQISYMFSYMTNLKTVYVSDLWDNSNIQEYYDNGTFDSDTQLVGEKGTTYDANYIGREYARVDNAPDSPGYFTYAKLYTVTYPDGSEELYPQNTIINLGHTASKATDQDVVVTFMNHNGTEDILSISDVSYTPNGFDIGGIHYDDESTLLVDSDKVINYSYNINSSFEFPENPTDDRRLFLGWYTEEEGGEKVESLDGITTNTTLHAHWSEELLKLTVDGKTTLVEPGYVYTIPHGIPNKNSDYITIYLEDSYNQDNKEVKISYGNAVNYQIIKGTKYYPGDTYVVNEDTNVTSNKSKDKTAVMDPYVEDPTYHDENGDYVFKGWIMANWDYLDPRDVNIDIYSLTPDDVLFDNQTFLADFGQINEEEQVRLTIIDDYKKNNYTYIVPKGLELSVIDIGTDLHNSRRTYIGNNINDDSVEYNYEIDALISHYLINDEEVPNEEGITRTINEDTTIEVVRVLTENEYCNDHETCSSIIYTEPYSRVSFDGVDNYIYTGMYGDTDGQGKMLTLSNFKPTGDPYGSLESTVYMHFIDGTNNIILTVDEDVSIIPKGMGVIPEAKEKADDVIPITLVYQDDETPNGVVNMTYKHTFEGYMKKDYWRVYNPGEEYDYEEDTYFYSSYNDEWIYDDLPEIDDDHFKGWWTEPEGGERVDELEYMRGYYEDYSYDTLYAHWGEPTVEICHGKGDCEEIIKGTAVVLERPEPTVTTAHFTLDYNTEEPGYDPKNVTTTKTETVEYFMINDERYDFGETYVFNENVDMYGVTTTVYTSDFEGYYSDNWDYGLNINGYELRGWCATKDGRYCRYYDEGDDIVQPDGLTLYATYYSSEGDTVRVTVDWNTTYDWPKGESEVLPDEKYNTIDFEVPEDYDKNINFDLNNESGETLDGSIHVTNEFIGYRVGNDDSRRYQRHDLYTFYKDIHIQSQYDEVFGEITFPEVNEPTFKGWYTKPEGGRKISTTEDFVKYMDLYNSFTLYAQYYEGLPEDLDIDVDNLSMVVGQVHQIDVTFTPDGSGDTLTYTGYDDTKISIVDGLVTALASGETIITVGTENTNIEKTITVTIINDKLESEVYEVRDKTHADDSISRIIIGAEVGTTLTEFKDNLLNPNEYIKIFDSNDNELEDETIVMTGQIIKIVYGNNVMDEAVIVVRGDLNGDGYVNVMDKIELTNAVIDAEPIDEITDYPRFAAADVEEDDFVNVMDKLKITNFITDSIDSLNN